MLWIAITAPGFMENEASFISTLLRGGVDIVHLRKPNGGSDGCARLLDRLNDEERSRIMIHDYPQLAVTYGLRGVHLNSRNTSVPQGFAGSTTRSCHTLEEVERFKSVYDYVFLSPIFDSISKSGYRSAFSPTVLDNAKNSGLIDRKVIALGGVTLSSLPLLRRWHFGGAAMLGCVNTLAGQPEHEILKTLCAMRQAFDRE